MKPLTIFMAMLSLLVLGCTDKQDLPPDFLRNCNLELTDGFCLVSGDQVVLNHRDIDYYDYAAHLVYLKDGIFFTEENLDPGEYSVYAGGDSIYSLTAMNAYDSYMPIGPLIWRQSFYNDYVMFIDFPGMPNPEHPEDPREDPRIEEALQKYDQFQAGLTCEIMVVTSPEPGQVLLELELKNEDDLDYCYLDPDKMGMGLFHYFTNGLFLSDASRETYTHRIEVCQPEPWDSWDPEWLSVIESGEKVHLSIEYPEFEAFPPGNYTAWFRFPGLHRVEKEDLQQAGGRIWLGNLGLVKSLTFD